MKEQELFDKASQFDNNVGNFTPMDDGKDDAYVQSVRAKVRQNCNAESIIREITKEYLSSPRLNNVRLWLLADEDSAEAEAIHDELMTLYDDEFNLENQVRKNGKMATLTQPANLPGYVAAQILIKTGDVRVMRTGKEGYKLIVKHYYRNASTNMQWKWSGWWQIIDEKDETNIIFRAYRLLCPNAGSKDKRAFLDKLRDSKTCFATQDNKLVFFRNGVWSFHDGTFTEYDDPNFDAKFPTQISLGKLPVYHPLGKAPVGKVAQLDSNGNIIEPVLCDRGDKTPWHPSQLFTDPFDMDTDVGKAASKIVQQAGHFLLRKKNSEFGYYHFWINASGKGRNMKSTIVDALMRLVRKKLEAGDEDLGDMDNRVIACAVENLSDNYVLAQNIMTAYAIIGEESNGTVTYVDKAATAKMLARRQECTYRNIYEKPFTFTFDGFLCQHSNKAPIFSEKNDSIISHAIVVPFEKTFDNPRAYIKQDYINRDIVASYFGYMFTTGMDLIEDYDADALKTLEPYKRDMLKASMTTFQFCDEALSGINMEIIPLELLYDLYIRWCELNGVQGRAVVSARVFQEDMEQYGLNNEHQVSFDRKKHRVKEADLSEPQEALRLYGSTIRLGETKFREMKRGSMNLEQWYLNRNAFTYGISGEWRQFQRGCLIRAVKYDDMHYDEKEKEDDEEVAE